MVGFLPKTILHQLGLSGLYLLNIQYPATDCSPVNYLTRPCYNTAHLTTTLIITYNSSLTLLLIIPVPIEQCLNAAIPIHFINGKCHIKKLKNCITGLTSYYICLSCELLIPLEVDTHRHAQMHTIHTY